MDLIRARDCIVFFKGDAQPVAVSDAMVAGGWPGGQGVQWVDNTDDLRMVTYSKGLYGGLLIWGSDETGDQYTSMTRNQMVYKAATFLSGGSLISTSSYERYTYTSRIGPGPLVPLVYKANDVLYFSLRGLWTNEDELTISLDLLRPAFFTGFVAQVPSPANTFWLGIQTSL
jgi:hypothetical protein